MEYMEFSAKTVNDAITEACTHFTVASDRLDYEVLEEGSSGFLGLGSKAAKIKARVKEEAEMMAEAQEKAVKEAKAKAYVNAKEVEDKSIAFLKDVLHAMDIAAVVEAEYDSNEELLNINLIGEDMGILIGKRGQTLDSLQYLVSLVVNKEAGGYIRVKVDTENYRERRKATLENLAHNIAFKVKRTRRSVSLEPMNPYERRIIHSALQNDKYVTTHSEGEEPYRKVVVTLKK
ncbi:MAG: protein jag [Lachnospiraceae bacterium]|nr:protein jag [Lachnospiraceae bacterium]